MTKPLTPPSSLLSPAHESLVTDELFERERDTDSALLLPCVADPEDFEHQRIFAKVRGQLFGRDGELHIGRYKVSSRIGMGGMGEVYLGEDAELGRKVALKRVLGPGSPREHARLRREAQLLAQLSHPNVVQIYEVGEHAGRTFLAMEYIEGETLSEWLDAERSRTEILSTFIAAGKGLAAAHGVGIVHRDFKPDNVLISSAGSVRVVDFGLALAAEDRVAEPELAALPSRVDPRTRLSATGSVVGTMSYMPLEQLLGHAVDARSDQFAFCIALYEALWDLPPFTRDTARARFDALARDDPRPPPGLVRGGWPALRRGLRRDPAARWPDMASLLNALERVPRRRRVRRGAALTLGMLGVALGGASLTAQPCAQLQPAWGAEQHATLERRLGALDDSQREELDVISESLERSTRQWSRAREELCRRARPWSSLDPDFQRARRVLERSSQRVHEFLTYLGEDSEHLVTARAALADLDRGATLEPPAQLSEQVEALELELDRARVARLFGDPTRGLERTRSVSQEVLILGYNPLSAQVLAEQAKLMDVLGHVQAELHYGAAIEFVRREGLDPLLVELLSARLLLHDTTQRDDARELLAQLEAALERLGLDPQQHPRYLYAHGYFEQLHGSSKLACSSYERALELEGEGAKQADYLRALARCEAADGDPAGALALYEASLVAAESFYGPRHRRTAKASHALALALQEQGRGPEARTKQLLTRAAQIWERFGPSKDALHARLALAKIALREDQLVEAEEQLELALALELVDHHLFALQAHLAMKLEQHERALAFAEQALAHYRVEGGPAVDSFYRSMRTIVATQCIALELPELRTCCYELGYLEPEYTRAQLGEACVDALAEPDEPR